VAQIILLAVWFLASLNFMVTKVSVVLMTKISGGKIAPELTQRFF
jgi:hypothetical protein